MIVPPLLSDDASICDDIIAGLPYHLGKKKGGGSRGSGEGSERLVAVESDHRLASDEAPEGRRLVFANSPGGGGELV